MLHATTNGHTSARQNSPVKGFGRAVKLGGVGAARDALDEVFVHQLLAHVQGSGLVWNVGRGRAGEGSMVRLGSSDGSVGFTLAARHC